MKKIALINDLSGFGKCSLTAAIPVISVMGMQACPLPTAVLSAQTGFDSYLCVDFTDKMNDITDEWRKLGVTFDGIYSGYLAQPQQVEKMLYFLKCFQKEDTIYLADPVLGDHGKPYDMFDDEMILEMMKLTRKADVITPNLTELCMLSGEDYEQMIAHCQDEDYIDRIKTVCMKLLHTAERAQTVVVTGIIHKKGKKEYIGNFAVSEKEEFYIENPYTGMGFSGTGDLFASVICGALVKGLSLKEAMQRATYFLQEAIEEASEEKIPAVHGVYFEKYLSRLM